MSFPLQAAACVPSVRCWSTAPVCLCPGLCWTTFLCLCSWWYSGLHRSNKTLAGVEKHGPDCPTPTVQSIWEVTWSLLCSFYHFYHFITSILSQHGVISGDFVGSEESGFYLYPVFADGEGEPVFTIGMPDMSDSFLAVVSVSYVTFKCFRITSCQYFCVINCLLNVYFTASRGDPAAYMMLMIISFLFIVLFVTLILSQNQ